jgi:class 3 adenylate cyclase
VSGCAASHGPTPPVAQNGRIALDAAALSRGVPLAGEWSFVWGRLVDPGATPQTELARESELIGVPGLWTAAAIGLPSVGRATYRLTVELPPEPNATLGLYLSGIHTAYRVYADGVLLAEQGRVAEGPGGVKGYLAPRTVYFEAAGTVDLTLQVANQDDVLAGLNAAPVLGNEEAVSPIQLRETLVDAVLYAAVLIMGLYHILLSLLHPDERASRYFGLLALDLAVRGFLTGSRVAQQLLGDLAFRGYVAAEYVTVYAGALLVYLYFYHLFPHERPGFLRVPLAAITAAYSVFVVAAPLRVIAPVHLVYEVFLLALGVLIIVWLIRAIRRHREGAALMLVGFVVLLGGAAYDIAVDVLDTGGAFVSAYAMLGFILLQAVLIARRYASAYNHNEALATAYSRFVPREMLSLLGKESILHVELGDQVEMEMTVLFADIRSFTTLSERMTPRENFNFLNSFLKRISPVIRNNHGFIDKYLGDGIMALFPGSPAHALRAAADMMVVLKEYNGHRARSGYDPICVGVGVNTGRLMLGTVGEAFRMEGTVISDVVNLASRLQSATRTLGVGVIVSDTVLASCPDAAGLSTRYLGRARLKGKSKSVRMYELVDPTEVTRVGLRERFEHALRSYEAHHHGPAREAFEQILAQDPTDPASRYYLGRLAALGAAAVP